MIKVASSSIFFDKNILCSNPSKGSYMIMFDIQESEEGFEYFQENFDYLPSIEEIKKIITGHYNKKCDEEILKGLEYDSSLVWLSTENQFNYKSAFDFAFQRQVLGKEFLPVTIKLGDENEEPKYKIFTNIEELSVFIESCFSHIQNTLAKYWNIKDSIVWSLYEIE